MPMLAVPRFELAAENGRELVGEAFEALTSDQFSFTGHFLERGLSTLRMNLLCPNGFIDPMVWHSDHAGSEYHATIRWMVREM